MKLGGGVNFETFLYFVFWEADPRESVLKWAQKASEEKFFTTVYDKTQPKRELDYTDPEEEKRKKRLKLDLL